jgi:hypothetical protein
MKKAPSIAHMAIAVITATTFLFQMATLIAYINTDFGERMVFLKGKTYMRSTIKNEAAEWARYVGN